MNIDENVYDYLIKALKPGQYLKITVTGGGCNGFLYKFDAVESIDINDVVLDAYVLTDKRSSLFLKDCTLQYKDSVGAKILTIHNPKAVSICGCGESFSL